MPDYRDEASEVDLAVVITLALLVIIPVMLYLIIASILPY